MPRKTRARALAAALALAVPLSAYAVGDAVDAFPGIVTIDQPAQGPVAGVPASGESLDADPGADVGDEEAESAASKSVDAARLQVALNKAADEHGIGQGTAFAVVDAGTGETLAERDAATPRAPASTMKLLTVLAAVRTLGPDARATTTVEVSGSTAVLVGGGDMLLTTEAAEEKEGVERASLADLADQTKASLAEAGVTEVTVGFDDSFFSPDPLNPAWGNNGPAGGWVAPIMSLGVDGGRVDGQLYGPKSTDPARDAADAFVRLLEQRGLTVKAEPTRMHAPEGATEVGSVTSAPVAEWIQHTLLYSDNTVAELLARHVAREAGFPTTVDGAKKAVASDLKDLAASEGFDVSGLVIADNSGLSHDNRVSPSFFAHLTAWASGEAPDDVRDVFSMVPVGGLTGTLAERFGAADAADARGLIRGKTGYLGGVSSLAGTTVLADGRIVGYSVVNYGFDGADALTAKAAVDSIASVLVEEPS